MAPFTAADVAERLGISVEHFYRSYARLVADEGMPSRQRARGHYTFDRADMERWLNPRTRLTAANDDAPPAPADTDWRAVLARAYGG